jgi:hypothetical protein
MICYHTIEYSIEYTIEFDEKIKKFFGTVNLYLNFNHLSNLINFISQPTYERVQYIWKETF